MQPTEYPRIMPVNESAVLVEFGDAIDYELNRKVYSLQAALSTSEISNAIIETIPTFRSLLVEYDFTKISCSEALNQIEAVVDLVLSRKKTAGHKGADAHELPVAYGGDFGPDLASVAEQTGLSQREVIDVHSSAEYRVFMLGFAPGFPYLGGMDERIACPRLATPRIRVPAGSVGIAESQTGIYPNESPGGWQIIGRSPSVLFDVDADPPSKLLPGSTVRFNPISCAEFEAILSQASAS